MAAALTLGSVLLIRSITAAETAPRPAASARVKVRRRSDWLKMTSSSPDLLLES